MIPQSRFRPEPKSFQRRCRLLDGQPKDEATVSRALEGMDDMLDTIAAGLYSMASMLVGEGEDSIGLVETAVARTDILGLATLRRSAKEQPEGALYGGD